MAGHPYNLHDLSYLAKKYNFWVIEDACHSLGASYTHSGNSFNSGACNHSNVATFSFHPVKHITTGEGVMITTNDQRIYQRLLNLRTHGIQQDSNKLVENHGPWYYEMQELGYNYRMNDIAATLGISQLGRLNDNITKRKAIAQTYD